MNSPVRSDHHGTERATAVGDVPDRQPDGLFKVLVALFFAVRWHASILASAEPKNAPGVQGPGGIFIETVLAVAVFVHVVIVGEVNVLFVEIVFVNVVR